MMLFKRKLKAAASNVQQEATRYMILPIGRSNNITRIYSRTSYSDVPSEHTRMCHPSSELPIVLLIRYSKCGARDGTG